MTAAAPAAADLPPGAQVVEDMVVPARGYLRARTVPAGHLVGIADVEGQQVADVVLTRAAEPRDWLSCLNTKLINGTEQITTGHVLHSKQCIVLATVVADTVGQNWFGGGFCSDETNRLRYGVEGTVSCKTNLTARLGDLVTSPHELELDSCASLFMNIGSRDDGRFGIDLPRGQAAIISTSAPRSTSSWHCRPAPRTGTRATPMTRRPSAWSSTGCRPRRRPRTLRHGNGCGGRRYDS